MNSFPDDISQAAQHLFCLSWGLLYAASARKFSLRFFDLPVVIHILFLVWSKITAIFLFPASGNIGCPFSYWRDIIIYQLLFRMEIFHGDPSLDGVHRISFPQRVTSKPTRHLIIFEGKVFRLPFLWITAAYFIFSFHDPEKLLVGCCMLDRIINIFL